MSEIAATTTVTESAPSTSTADVASNVIDAFEQTETADSGIEVSGGTPEPVAEPVAEAQTTPEPVAPSPEDAEIEALLGEFGFKDARKPDGREHYIPRSKVLKMIGSGLKRGQEKWTTERGVFEGQVAAMRGHLEQLRAGVAGDPKAFLSEIASIDPRYRAFLEPASQPAATRAADPDAEMPAPDLQLADGSATYSLEGLQKLLEWNTKRVESRLEAKMKPWEDRDKQFQQAQAQQELAQRSMAQIETAKGWPGWAEYEGDVLKRLQQDSAEAQRAGARPRMTLREAYLEVRGERLSTDHNKVREAVLAELKQAPRGPAVSRQTVDAPRAVGPMTTQDIAARTLARLERS